MSTIVCWTTVSAMRCQIILITRIRLRRSFKSPATCSRSIKLSVVRSSTIKTSSHWLRSSPIRRSSKVMGQQAVIWMPRKGRPKANNLKIQRSASSFLIPSRNCKRSELTRKTNCLWSIQRKSSSPYTSVPRWMSQTSTASTNGRKWSQMIWTRTRRKRCLKRMQGGRQRAVATTHSLSSALWCLKIRRAWSGKVTTWTWRTWQIR